jgi:hypothetical protein
MLVLAFIIVGGVVYWYFFSPESQSVMQYTIDPSKSRLELEGLR